jgi:hypothetical protein
MTAGIARRWWVGLGVAVVTAVGVGVYFLRPPAPTSPAAPSQTPDEDPLPVRVVADGWELTCDCSLVLDPPAVVRVSPVGKYIFTPGVGLVPTNRAAPTHHLRRADGLDLRVEYIRVPLKLSKTIPGRGDDLILTENDEPGVPVTTLVVKAGTLIMPGQPADVTDRDGKLVLRHSG